MKKSAMAVTLLLTVCVPFIVSAQDRPAPQAAAEVISYYHNGKGQGAILMEVKLCAEIATEGPDKNECKVEITNGIVGKNQKVSLWMNYLVPVDDVANILIQYKHNNRIRKVHDISIPAATRYRLWKSIPTNRTGDWEITIIQELESTDIPLGTLKYQVVEDPQE